MHTFIPGSLGPFPDIPELLLATGPGRRANPGMGEEFPPLTDSSVEGVADCWKSGADTLMPTVRSGWATPPAPPATTLTPSVWGIARLRTGVTGFDPLE